LANLYVAHDLHATTQIFLRDPANNEAPILYSIQLHVRQRNGNKKDTAPLLRQAASM